MLAPKHKRPIRLALNRGAPRSCRPTRRTRRKQAPAHRHHRCRRLRLQHLSLLEFDSLTCGSSPTFLAAIEKARVLVNVRCADGVDGTIRIHRQERRHPRNRRQNSERGLERCLPGLADRHHQLHRQLVLSHKPHARRQRRGRSSMTALWLSPLPVRDCPRRQGR